MLLTVVWLLYCTSSGKIERSENRFYVYCSVLKRKDRWAVKTLDDWAVGTTVVGVFILLCPETNVQDRLVRYSYFQVLV